jgi:hypothetical protein
MRGIFYLAIGLLYFLCGCQTSSMRDLVAIEYNLGTTPHTITAKCDATFTLTSSEPSSLFGDTSIELKQGTPVGFRQEQDGSIVAIAGQEIFHLQNERSVWLYTPKPKIQWDQLKVKAREDCPAIFGTTMAIITFPLWLPCAFTGVWP